MVDSSCKKVAQNEESDRIKFGKNRKIGMERNAFRALICDDKGFTYCAKMDGRFDLFDKRCAIPTFRWNQTVSPFGDNTTLASVGCRHVAYK